MQNDDDTPVPGADLDETEISGEQEEVKSTISKPLGAARMQNPDKV